MLQDNTEVAGNDTHPIFQGGGEMGALMRAFDWEKHPMGNPRLWSESLKMNIRLLLNSGFPMFIWWSKELYMFHNDAYLPALGNKHPQALGASARVMWAEIWEELGVVVDDILEGGKPFYAEALLLLLERKGFPEETYWTFSYSPAFEDQGQVAGIFCACSEVTSTVLSERRLKSLKDVSEEMAQIQTLEEAGQLTCDILLQNQEDLPFCLIYLLDSPTATARLIGRAGAIAAPGAAAIIDLQEESTPWDLRRVLASGQMALLDGGCLHQAHGAGVKQVAVLPVMRPGQNHIIGFFIAGISPRLVYNADYQGFHALLAGQIATSVTSIQAREELARQQQYLKDIFQQAPVGITIVRGPDHTIDLANPAVCDIWGRTPEQVLGKPVREALPEVSAQGVIQLLDKVIHTGEPFIANELPLSLNRDGKLETVYLNFIYHPMRDAHGSISGVIAIAIDISEQISYRRSLETLNAELLTANADLDNFVYSASHDLKAPILNIEGLMEALIEDLPENALDSEMVKRVIGLIQSSVNRFKRTVTDLTEVAKIQRQADEDVSCLYLNRVIAEVLLDFESLVTASGAILESTVSPDVVLRFSAKNLRSIVYNLLSNALKYRSPERTPHIRILAQATPEHVMLSVQDNGLGIDLEDESKLFAMFKRLHDHVEGSGIGLYIVKRIVENAGGFIEVESQVGLGSTFRIYFPCESCA